METLEALPLHGDCIDQLASIECEREAEAMVIGWEVAAMVAQLVRSCISR
jgi:hypothetical protein